MKILHADVKHFIEKYIDLIEEERFQELYDIAADEVGTLSFISELTTSLLLADIDILKSTNKIPEGFLYRCIIPTITTLEIPNHIKEIGHRAFENCRDLTELTLPLSLEYMGQEVFNMCVQLRKINWNAINLRSSHNIFRGCMSLEEINFNGTKSQWEALKARCTLVLPLTAHPLIIKCTDAVFRAYE